MSFNINGTQGDEHNTWAVRAPLNLSVIRRYAPDLIGLQEVAQANLDTYCAQLADYALVVGNCYGDMPPQEYTSILYKTARYELLDTGEFWFSETPDVESADWGVEYPMGATWVKLRCLLTDTLLFYLNTHFEDGAEGERSRVNASQLIIRGVAQLAADMPAVLSGDFNCNPWSAPYRLFLDGGFTDTYRAAGNADTAESSTFHGYRGREYFALEYGDEMYWRVDWILAKDGWKHRAQTTASTIVRDALPPTYSSDHYPMLSEIKLL
jgi:endonuclease/exonuclease/phosphatase family metal-dependent hydrolase